MPSVVERAAQPADRAENRAYSRVGGFAGFGFGVFGYAWGKVGFWWAVLYGVFWIPWLGYRVAEALNLGQ